MPVYEYACKACGQHLEVSQSFTDDPLTVCPSCGGQLRKVFNSIGISFKGTGFYRTDSRMAARAKDTDKDTKEPKDKKDKATADSSGGSGSGSGDKAKSTTGSSGDTSSSSAKPDTKTA